ncbi:LacI family DNA-binding transcriptional regulator [Bifidobacterium sp. ESL0775]|uniref:LacI family DNA-binding transcriptional regulator n=1 Tax=Bifidobacterium sp. ESL0775 TaxID=2983230 RepID=UPI0023F80066|nr:LacI family DNA-binding transcriptional regulator [Bifidobacterium sp. ESL0775]WEV68552.1 LacI family DNA-binding transcriptional regulator [Bifidobacterium sp. ESL0775]
MTVTMKDIARKSGVSTSAVSLVLSGRSDGRVSVSTAERIRAIADDYGYSPNPLAQSLRTKRTHTIGLLSNQVVTLPFPSELLAGAQKAAFDSNYLMLFIDTNNDKSKEKSAYNALLQRNVDALIVAVPDRRTVAIPELPADLPVVLLNSEPSDENKDIDSIVPDDEGGAFNATNLLISKGHKRIAYCSVDGYVATNLRMKGYLNALKRSGITFNPDLVVKAPSVQTATAIDVAIRLLSQPNRPSAVCCFCDQIGMAFYEAAGFLGFRIPDDLSIVGFDNQRFVAEALSPGLTTIELPLKKMGEWATRRVIEKLESRDDGQVSHINMKCPLIERESIAARKS